MRTDIIKNNIEKLYEAKVNVHVTMKLTRSNVSAEDVPAKITGVYRNLFQIKEIESPCRLPRQNFQYNEVLTGQVTIKELDSFWDNAAQKR